MTKGLAFCFALALGSTLIACGDSTGPTTLSGGGGNGGGNGGGSPEGGGGSAPAKPEAGIDGCAKIFVEADGVCRPTSSKCKAGTIPKFDTGCVPVGISKCDAAFLENDGLCHPSMEKCSAGTFAVPSEGCVSIDGASGCGTDTFGVIVEMAGDQHVDGTYTGGASDGSRSAPWTTIADALAHVASGGRVVVAAGDYPEGIQAAIDVDIVGRCASMVSLSGTVPVPNSAQATVAIAPMSPHKLGLQGLTLKGDGAGIYVGSGSLDADGIVIKDATVMGIIVGSGAPNVSAKLHHVFVDGVTASAGQFGGAADFSVASTVTVTQSAFAHAVGWGILVENAGANATISDTLIEDIQLDAGGQGYAFGIVTDYGAVSTVDNIAAVSTLGPGLAVYDAFSMNVKDSLVDKAGPSTSAYGVLCQRSTALQSGNDFVGEGLAITNTQGIGISAYNFAKVVVSRSLVRGGLVAPAPSSASGAFDVEKGSSLTVTDSAAVDSQGTGLYGADMGSHALFTRVLIEGMKEIPSLPAFDVGQGVTLNGSVAATLSRVALIGDTTQGITAVGASVSVDHALISGTHPSSLYWPGAGGVGVDAYNSAVTLKAVLVEKSQGAGVDLIATTSTIDGLVIDGVASGQLLVHDSNRPPVAAGDGLLVGLSQTLKVSVAHAWTTGAARAGFLFASSDATLDGSYAEKDLYGLVTQGSPVPKVGADNQFSGSMMDVLANGTLSAP